VGFDMYWNGKKHYPTIMVWGMIGWNYKVGLEIPLLLHLGIDAFQVPFYIWSTETEKEREEAEREIAALNKEIENREVRMNDE